MVEYVGKKPLFSTPICMYEFKMKAHFKSVNKTIAANSYAKYMYTLFLQLLIVEVWVTHPMDK